MTQVILSNRANTFHVVIELSDEKGKERDSLKTGMAVQEHLTTTKDLTDMDLSKGLYIGVDFTETDLTNTDLSDSVFHNCVFARSQMIQTLCVGCRFLSCDLSEAALLNCDFDRAKVSDTTFPEGFTGIEIVKRAAAPNTAKENYLTHSPEGS